VSRKNATPEVFDKEWDDKFKFNWIILDDSRELKNNGKKIQKKDQKPVS